MALNTIDTYLLQGTGSGTPLTYTKIVDIKDYSDIYGDAETLDTTTLSDKCYTYIKGLQTNEPITFTANYTYSDFNTLKGLDDGTEKHFKIAFGHASSKYGTDGYFTFDGYLNVKIVGKGVNEVREMEISIVRSSDISYGQES